VNNCKRRAPTGLRGGVRDQRPSEPLRSAASIFGTVQSNDLTPLCATAQKSILSSASIGMRLMDRPSG
jgi:hypothetical protein